MLIEMRTVTLTEKRQISIPKKLCDLKNFKAGTKFIILVLDDRIEIRPLEEYLERMYPALMSEKKLKEVWDSPEEDEAWKDL